MYKVNYERQNVSTQVRDLDIEYLTLGQAKAHLSFLIDEFGEDAKIFSSPEEYSDSGKEYLRIFTTNLESDLQFEERIAKEENWAAQKETWSRAEFYRLLKIYGNK